MRKIITRYLMVALGCFMIAAAINLFFIPHRLLSSGVTGIAIIFHWLFDWPVGIQLIVMNAPLLVLAFILIGRSYGLTTLFGTVLLAFAIDLTSFLNSYSPVDDKLLAAVAGGVIAGIGGGLSFRVNGSLGGLDVISTITKKYYSLNVGMVGFMVNFCITLVGAALYGVEIAILTLISMFIGSRVTDTVVDGFNRKKSVYIISYKPDDVIKAVLMEVGRGATILHGEGAYTKQQKEVIFIVVRLTQIAKLKQSVREADPEAFMIINDAYEVLGKGFSKM